MSDSGSCLDWAELEGLLPSGCRKLAADKKPVKPNLPKHMGTKVTDIGQILRLVLYQCARNIGQQAAAAAFAAAGLLAISHVALHQWMKKLGPYLAELVAIMVAESARVFLPELWAVYELIGVDATCVQRPGAKVCEHIDVLGRYSFAMPEAVAMGKLRPLRNLDETNVT